MTTFDREQHAARLLASLLDSSDDAILTLDLDGVILTWSPGARRLLDYEDSEAVGRPISMLVPETAEGELDAALTRVRSGERLERREMVWRARDGRLLDVLLTVLPLMGADDRPIGLSCLARDVSARKRRDLERRTSEGRWRALVDSAVDGIIVIDAAGRMEAVNPAAERLFGYREAEMLGRNVTMLMPAPYRDEHDGYLARYLETGLARIIGVGREVTGLRRDGTTFPLRLSVGEMSIGGERKFTGILHDLSERVRMEEQLREQAALVRLGEMAAVIAHEVKNPLAGVRGAIQVIGGRLPPESRDVAVVKEIVARIDSLNEMMKDLLLFARPPRLRPGPVELASLVSSTAEILRQDPAMNNIDILIEGSAPRIQADSGLLGVAFLNLLVNSAHAMQGRGRIRVSLGASTEFCAIAISDSGPGIPPEIREKVFAPFFTTKSRGTGLGLPTAKRLVEAHLGTIQITCPAGGGTTVSIELPLTP